MTRARVRKRQALLADINITNLVDVTLVLLIIFIIVAPFLDQGLKINLPQAKGVNVPKDAVEVQIDAKGGLAVGGEPVTLDTIVPKLLEILGDEKETRPVHIRGDEDARLGDVLIIVSKLKVDGGITSVNMLTEPDDS